MSHPVAITGMGCVSGLGLGVGEHWRRLTAGEGAIRELDRGGPVTGPASWIEPDTIAEALDGKALRELGRLDPLSTYALLATIEAVGQAGLAGHPVLSERTAVMVGCGSGGNATIDTAFERLYARGQAKVHPQTIPSSMISAPASHISMMLGIHGPSFVLASACASSAHALGEAMHMLRAGRVDVAIAGGSEACLSPGSLVAWNSLGVLAPDTCRPFSSERKGLVLGEGAAIIVLEHADHARQRGATILGELAGYGASSDAAHITAPDQSGIELAIRAAHRDAGMDVSHRALISSHGTGTKLNDAAEAGALRAVYGDALGQHTVIATKSAHGHLIGAGGALEFLIGMKALAEGVAPPVLNHLGPDPDCDVPLALEAQAIDCDTLVSNSFAFGGLNAVLVGKVMQ
ncbi:MAG: beta-ketoacyl-[acyl-carrier-protein] synthase family protein [Novosphingobium sp.]|nr:beta-ketoacyl-[acyl-carrier-protein] synthase family protein [Novosphingobium sp.]